jgi:CRP/FNR family transcriptional regulator, cyclic AMP receptor protein
MKRSDTVVSRLAEIPIFASCTRRELALVSRLATQVEIVAGAELTTQGRPGNEFAIILDGTASLSVDSDVVTTLTVGDHYGEMALLDDGPRTATITALTPMSLAVVGRRDFRNLLDQSPILARALLVGLARRLREVETRTSI